jgi:acyl-coenzyme A synthetase/AMP-(fatty) acid ligase
LTFRTPKRVLITGSIPKNAYGKVDRAQIRQVLEAADGKDAGAKNR